MIWVGSLNLLNQAVDAQVAGGNSQFVLGCTAWLCGQDTGVLIAAKSLSGDQLVVSARPGGPVGQPDHHCAAGAVPDRGRDHYHPAEAAMR